MFGALSLSWCMERTYVRVFEGVLEFMYAFQGTHLSKHTRSNSQTKSHHSLAQKQPVPQNHKLTIRGFWHVQIAQTEHMTDQPAVMQGARHGPTVAGASEEMCEAGMEPHHPLKTERPQAAPGQGCHPEQQEESLGEQALVSRLFVCVSELFGGELRSFLVSSCTIFARWSSDPLHSYLCVN